MRRRRMPRLKLKIRHPRRVRHMARRRRFGRRARTIYRAARISYRRGSRGIASGGMIHKVEMALGKGLLYGGVASKFAPQLAPFAGLYGEWKGGGLAGLGITELLVKPFLGMPSYLGGLGIGNILGGLTGGAPSGQAMGGAV